MRLHIQSIKKKQIQSLLRLCLGASSLVMFSSLYKKVVSEDLFYSSDIHPYKALLFIHMTTQFTHCIVYCLYPLYNIINYLSRRYMKNLRSLSQLNLLSACPKQLN